MKIEQNGLEKLLYPSSVQQTKKPVYTHLYERGMFISINNHKSTSAELWSQYKRQYQTILYGLTGKNISKNEIKVSTGKVPSKQTIMNTAASKKLLVVAGIHDYKPQDKRGKGSRRNFEYQHTHFYVYGAHHFLPDGKTDLEHKVNHLASLLQRHTKTTNKKFRLIKIQPVGTGKHIFSDNISPTTLYDYLLLPQTDITKDSVINYIARNRNNPSNNYPLTYLYT